MQRWDVVRLVVEDAFVFAGCCVARLTLSLVHLLRTRLGVACNACPMPSGGPPLTQHEGSEPNLLSELLRSPGGVSVGNPY